MITLFDRCNRNCSMKHCFMKRANKTDTLNQSLNQYLEHDFDEIESIDSQQSMNGYDGLSLDK